MKMYPVCYRCIKFRTFIISFVAGNVGIPECRNAAFLIEHKNLRGSVFILRFFTIVPVFRHSNLIITYTNSTEIESFYSLMPTFIIRIGFIICSLKFYKSFSKKFPLKLLKYFFPPDGYWFCLSAIQIKTSS